MRAPARVGAWRKLRQARPVGVGRRGSVASGAAAASASAFPPAPAQRSRIRSPVARGAGQRDQLAALVLHLDQPGRERRMLVDPAVGGQANAPRTERRRRRSSNLLEQFVARRPGDIDPQVERRALEQSGPFVTRRPVAKTRVAANPGRAPAAAAGSPSASAVRARAADRTALASAGSSSASPRIAARPLGGRSAERRIARNTSSRTARRSFEPGVAALLEIAA